jgi:hypothetical protein
MRELTHYFEIAKKVIEIENDKSTNSRFSTIFEFPFTDDYWKWINIRYSLTDKVSVTLFQLIEYQCYTLIERHVFIDKNNIIY